MTTEAQRLLADAVRAHRAANLAADAFSAAGTASQRAEALAEEAAASLADLPASPNGACAPTPGVTGAARERLCLVAEFCARALRARAPHARSVAVLLRLLSCADEDVRDRAEASLLRIAEDAPEVARHALMAAATPGVNRVPVDALYVVLDVLAEVGRPWCAGPCVAMLGGGHAQLTAAAAEVLAEVGGEGDLPHLDRLAGDGRFAWPVDGVDVTVGDVAQHAAARLRERCETGS